MINILKPVKSLIREDAVHTDNNIFALHYKFTVSTLLLFSILLTSKQYFGDPIDCNVETRIPKTLIDTYCWIHGTYILKHTLTRDVMPGLGSDIYDADEKSFRKLVESGEIITQQYYQWVCVLFAFQALMFAVPRFLWRTWEGGRLRVLVKDLNGPVVASNWNVEGRAKLVDYIVSRKYEHYWYTLRFAFCEVLNLVNVIGQIALTDWLFDGRFLSYGISVMTYTKINPMQLVFPKIAKCTFRHFGHSGSEQLLDALCLLPLNMLNEKLFVFVWAWFWVLVILSFYQVLYRIAGIVSGTFRGKILRARCRYLSKKSVDVLIEHFSFGDMYFLELMAKNLNPIVYKDLIIEIAATVADRYKTRTDDERLSV